MTGLLGVSDKTLPMLLQLILFKLFQIQHFVACAFRGTENGVDFYSPPQG